MNPAHAEISNLEGKIADAQALISVAEEIRNEAYADWQDQVAVAEAKEAKVVQYQNEMQNHLTWVNNNRGGQLSLTSSHPYWAGFPGVPTSSDTYMDTITHTTNKLHGAVQAFNQAVSLRNELKAIYDVADDDYRDVFDVESPKIISWQNQIDVLNAAYAGLISSGVDPDVAGQIAFDRHQQDMADAEFKRQFTKWAAIVGGVIAAIVALVWLFKYLKNNKIIK